MASLSSKLLLRFAGRYARGMENPYQSPPNLPGEATAASRGGLARQVPIVAILLMVQGGLEILMGGFLLLMAGTFAVVAAQQDPLAANPNGPLGPQVFGWALGGTYGVMGFGGLAIGALKASAGWRNYGFRGRVLGIAALVSGVLSLVTCYCFPTAVLLMIYGLIVYLNAETAWAFSMGDQGLKRDRILWHLLRDTSV